MKMKYREDRYGNKLSCLGFGCMRFPRSGGRIDMEETERELLRAYEAGINYFDTAYIYPGSEAAIGEIFEKHGIRSKVHIATKLPHYMIRSAQSLDKYFEEHLKRLRTDYIDYYLMHMLNDISAWEKLKALGIVEWLEEKKRTGQIRQVGFSYHGNSDMFCRILDAYDWDFCQIQYNYMDEHSQAGREGLQYAHSKGLPVVIMEPLRGGRLAKSLPVQARQIIKKHSVHHSPAGWAFLWLWNQEEVTVVLSGMNSMEMLEENIRTASHSSAGLLTEDDLQMLDNVAQVINSKMKVGCTGCHYCMPCPQGVDIPGTFSAYNRCYSEGRMTGFREYLMTTALRKDSASASQCIGCGACERHCPQHIQIREELKNARKVLENPAYHVVRKGVEVLHLYG